MIEIQNKIEFQNNCWVGSVDSSNFNSSEEARVKAVTDLAAITRGRLGYEEENYSNAQRRRLYHSLLTESAGKPSVPFEFIPIWWHQNCDFSLLGNFYKYSIFTEWEALYTNLRNLIINGQRGYKSVINEYKPANEENKISANMFKIIVGRVPWKVISHLRTHRAFSWLVESSRNKRYLNEVEFWYPSWWNEQFTIGQIGVDKRKIPVLQMSIALGDLKPEEATMELSDRRLVKFAMAAWHINKDDAFGTESAWDNLFAVRGKGTGTQSITGETVENIKKLIYEYTRTKRLYTKLG